MMNRISAETSDFVAQGYQEIDEIESRLSASRDGGDSVKDWSGIYGSVSRFTKAVGALGFNGLQSRALALEKILGSLERGQIQPQAHVVGHLLNLAENLRQHLDQIANSGADIRMSEPKPLGPDSSPSLVQKLVPFNPSPWPQKTLVFRTPDDGRMAMPFENVMRLEAFHETALEKEAERDGIRLKDRWIPLVDVSRILPERRIVFRRPPVEVPKGQTRQVIVYVTPYGEIGLLVDAILDVFKTKVEIQHPASRAGVHGSMELQERITEILDIPAILNLGGLALPPALPGQKIAS